MAMKLAALLQSDGAAVYYTPQWRQMIETHLLWLRQRTDNQVLTVTPAQAYRYEGDLMGLLTEMRVAPVYHWLIMRMNGWDAPTDYTSDIQTLVLPNYQVVEQLTNVHRTTMAKIK